MRFINFLTILVLISFASAFDLNSLSEIKTLKTKSSYAEQLIQTLNLNLQTGGSEDIAALLDSLKADLVSDQATATATWEALDSQLDTDISNLTDLINKLTAEITQETADKVAYEALLKQGEANVVQYENQVEANNKALQENETRRQRDFEEYTQSMKDHDDMLSALQAVINELKTLRGSVSDASVRPDHVEVNQFETRDDAWKASQSSFLQLQKTAPSALLLAQMATRANQDKLEEVIALLEDIHTKTDESKAADKAHEEASILEYEDLKKSLNEDNETLKGMIAEQISNNNFYKSEITRLTDSIASKSAQKAAAENDKAAKIEQKRIAKETHDNEKAEREKEMGVIDRLKEIVTRELQGVNRFLN